MHPDKFFFNNIEPKFSNYYSPPKHQKNGELIFISMGMLGAGFFSKPIFFIYNFIIYSKMAEMGDYEDPIDDDYSETAKLLNVEDEEDDQSYENLEMRETSTSRSRFDPYGGQPRLKEIPFGGTPQSMRSITESMREIKENFPLFDELDSPFASKMKNGRILVWLTDRRNAGKYFLFDENGKINEKKLSPRIIKALGPRVEDLMEVRKYYKKMKARELDFRRTRDNEVEVSVKGENKWTALFTKD